MYTPDSETKGSPEAEAPRLNMTMVNWSDTAQIAIITLNSIELKIF